MKGRIISALATSLVVMSLLTSTAGVTLAGVDDKSASATPAPLQPRKAIDIGGARGGQETPEEQAGTAFTYQGSLKDGQNPANGQYDLMFTLFDALTGGNQVGSAITITNQAVTNGLFAVQLDFGPSSFQGSNRWLEIAVRPAGGGTFTTLSPRQPLTAAPYAMSLVPGAVITGTIPQGTAALTGNSTGNGSGLYGVTTADSNGAGVSGESTGLDGNGVFGVANNGSQAWGVGGLSANGVGVGGMSTTGTGVYGTSSGTNQGGVVGENSSGFGVIGNGYTGVSGTGTLGDGVRGTTTYGRGGSFSSTSGNGVYGLSNGADGILGVSAYTNTAGLHGQDSVGYGVAGDGITGVLGVGTAGEGVRGQSNSGRGGSFTSNSNIGVYGQTNNSVGGYFISNTGNGVFGHSNSADGIVGVSAYTNTTGLLGQDFVGYGVVGNGVTGVWGTGSSGDGVLGQTNTGRGGNFSSNSGYGVYGQSSSSNGVYGVSTNGAAGYFTSTNGSGVDAHANSSAPGVNGINTASGIGVHGQAATGDGVQGYSASGTGVAGISSGSSSGVYGTSTSGYGVYGYTGGTNDAVVGQNAAGGKGVSGSSATGTGVYGSSSGTNQGGVVGENSSGFGVIGNGYTGVSGTGTDGDGVRGATTNGSGGSFTSTNGSGVSGTSTNGIGGYFSSVSSDAVQGHASGTYVSGVAGFNGAGGPGTYGTSANGPGVEGVGSTGYGVYGSSDSGDGVYGASNSGNGATFSTSNYARYGVQSLQFGAEGTAINGTANNGGNSVGVVGSGGGDGVDGFGQYYGVYGKGTSTDHWAISVYGADPNYHCGSCYAGYFDYDLGVNGTLYANLKDFKIDDPLDPANKYLYHTSVESPDMLDIYRGHVALDDQGSAWVQMPDYFQALNEDFDYQLTPIGAAQPNLYVAEEIKDNRFKIAGGVPGAKVSWQVTGVRHDPYAVANRAPVEQEKPQEEKGLYQHPELYNQPPSKGISTIYERGKSAPPAPPTPPTPLAPPTPSAPMAQPTAQPTERPRVGGR